MKTATDYSVTTQILALSRLGGVGPRMLDGLLQHFGNPAGILNASASSLLHIAGMTSPVASRIAGVAARLSEAEEYCREMERRGISLFTRYDDNYGHLLFELNDPPAMLYVRGKLPSPQKKSAALVGAHNAGTEGIELTVRLAKQFAHAGVQAISSLAGGIDVAVHLGVKAAGGQSFAVLDIGFDQLDSQDKMPVAIDIAQSGGVISEYAPDYASPPEALEESNRLMAGLAQAVVVTEIYQDSRRVHDLLKFCAQIGKLTFVVIDKDFGPLCDRESLNVAVKNGAIVLQGPGQASDIIKSLV